MKIASLLLLTAACSSQADMYPDDGTGHLTVHEWNRALFDNDLGPTGYPFGSGIVAEYAAALGVVDGAVHSSLISHTQCVGVDRFAGETGAFAGYAYDPLVEGLANGGTYTCPEVYSIDGPWVTPAVGCLAGNFEQGLQSGAGYILFIECYGPDNSDTCGDGVCQDYEQAAGTCAADCGSGSGQ